MTPEAQPPVRRHRIWPWVVGICLAPFVVIGAVAVSVLTLDRDARVLRREVMAASDAHWHTKVQFTCGGLTLGALRTALAFVHHKDNKDIATARLALGSVKEASVGLYMHSLPEANWSRERLFVNTDQAMSKRGWTRLVGVADGRQAVLVYTSDFSSGGDDVDVCLAVVNGQELVVASTTVNASSLAELVATQAGADFKQSFHLAMH